MSDYTQTTDFSAKDSLETGATLKKILGADIDTELDAISTAIASKTDTSDHMMIRLETQTASGDSSSAVDMETSINSTYRLFMMVGDNIVPQTDSASLIIRVGTGATPTYQSGASDYAWAYQEASAAEVANGSYDEADSEIDIPMPLGDQDGEEGRIIVWVYNPASTVQYTGLNYQCAGRDHLSGRVRYGGGTGIYLATTAVTGIRFAMSSGNINGNFTSYGIK